MSDPRARPSNLKGHSAGTGAGKGPRESAVAGLHRDSMLHTGQPRSHGACSRPLRETRNEIRNMTPVHREEQVPACHSFEAAGWKCAADRGQQRPTSNPRSKRVPAPACGRLAEPPGAMRQATASA